MFALWLLACAPELQDPTPSDELCDDGVDNDLDGRVDCDDIDCLVACRPSVEEDCADGRDEDVDGLTDCEDPDCEEACAPEQELDCGDGLDDDWDGHVDCADPDCSAALECPEDCDNGADDDADGEVDCADSECSEFEACIEVCEGGQDEDLDGLVDCEDPDCAAACAPEHELDCSDGLDEDLDGLVDCEDGDCSNVCAETCDNGKDDDGDGQRDCNDDECWGLEVCVTHERIQIHSGELVLDRQRWALLETRLSGTTSYLALLSSSYSGGAVLTNLSGATLRESAHGSWSCPFTVDRIDFVGSGYLGPVTAIRSGFHSSGGCGLSTSELPQTFYFLNAGSRAGLYRKVSATERLPWYFGAVTAGGYNSFGTLWTSHSGYFLPGTHSVGFTDSAQISSFSSATMAR